VADEDFHSLIHSQGTQQTRLGNDIESRFWLSYRPYESKNVVGIPVKVNADSGGNPNSVPERR